MSSVARRYARAILSVVARDGSDDVTALEKAGDELLALAGMAKAPGVAAALANPLVSESKRRDLANSIAGDLGVSPAMVNFVRLLADKQRLDQIPAIADHYRRLVDEQLGRVRALVTSAEALDPTELEQIVEVFEKKIGKKVLAECSVDPDLLGGVIVDIDGQVFDGSLRNRLKRMAAKVAGDQSHL